MDNMFEGALRVSGDKAFIDIEAKPNSKHPGIQGFEPWRKRFIVAIKAPPSQGKANRELCETLEDALGVKGASIESGHTSHQKTASFPLRPGDQERIASVLKQYYKTRK